MFDPPHLNSWLRHWVHANLGHELDTVKSSLSAEIAALSAAVDCALPSPSAPTVDLGGDDAGLLRHCVTQ
jgi:hypothetical protein